MSFLISSSGLTTRHVLHQYGALSRTYSTPVRPLVESIAYVISARFNSRSTRPAAKSARPASSSERPILQRGAKVTKVGDESARKAWPSSNSMRTAGQPSVAYFLKNPAVQPAKPPHLTKPFDSTRSVDDAQRRQDKNPGNEYLHEYKESGAHLWSTTHERIPLLWHGIWSLLAVAGVYGTLAYLDVKAGIPSSDGSQLPERATLSQSWYLTPTVISEGIKATWNALDDITITFILVNTAMWLPPARRLLGRSGLRGLRPFQVSHHSWLYGAKQAAYEGVLLVLFLPGVVHYFDGDFFHIAAIMTSVPLITLNFWNLGVRYNLIPPISMILGPRYGNYAIFGVYCVAYATEKMWVPQTLIFRLEPWSLLLAQVSVCGVFLARGPAVLRLVAMVCIGLPTLIEHVLTPYRRLCLVLCLAAHMPYAT
jgi:hypothetical protein